MKLTDKPTQGQKIWILPRDKWIETTYLRPTNSENIFHQTTHSPYDLHFKQIRLTPPKKKPLEFKVGDRVALKGTVSSIVPISIFPIIVEWDGGTKEVFTSTGAKDFSIVAAQLIKLKEKQ